MIVNADAVMCLPVKKTKTPRKTQKNSTYW